ncbi:MAG: hypothetical protein FD138_797 [Planctomycetota bacterium]|nr:MAG: hypothetical protein FD138_797 [Planctomycetota bacterium]
MQLVITPVGEVRCLYDESLDLSALGSIHIQRGSYVEPDLGGQWFANLSPVDGPRLGPFSRRSDALSAEVAWLRDHWLVPPMLSDSSALV